MSRRTGEAHPGSKLTQEQVDAIRKSRMGPSELARMYKVSKATISMIKSGKLWKDGDTRDTTHVISLEEPSVVSRDHILGGGAAELYDAVKKGEQA